jgi:hypothetical protein
MLLAPPTIDDFARLGARTGLFAHVVGTVELGAPDHVFVEGTLKRSGQRVPIRGALADLEELDASEATLLVHVAEEDGVVVLGVLAACPGRVPECGVDRP